MATQAPALPRLLDALAAGYGLTEEELAATLGVDPGAVRDWRAGRRHPDAATRARIEGWRQLHERLVCSFTDAEGARLWLDTPNPALEGERPGTLVRQGRFQPVDSALGQLEWGIMA